MLPDFGWTELLLIAIVLIVVVGPKDLPRVVRGFSKSLGNMRKMAGDFRKQFDDALSEAELDDLKTLASDVKSMDPRNSIKDALNPLSKVGQDINDELKGITKSIEGDDLPDPVIEPPKKVATPDEHYPQLAKMRKEREAEAAVAAAAEKKAPAKKTAAKKPAAKQAATKPAAAKPTAAKATAKKPAVAKTAAKKQPAKKPTAKAGDKA